MKMAVAGVLALALGASVSGQVPERATPQKKPGQSVRFDVLIVDLAATLESPTAQKILELDQAGKVNSRARFQLTSLEELPALIQYGELISRVSGRTVAGFRGRGAGGPGGAAPPPAIPQYTSVNVGTNLRLTARVADDGTILTQFYLERTGLEGGADQPFDPSKSTPPTPIQRLQAETTLRLKAGEPQVVGGQQAVVGQDANRTWVVITAQLAGGPDRPAGNANPQ